MRIGAVIVFALTFASTAEPATFYKARAAALLILSRRPQPTPAPTPAPAGICSNCNGTGRLGDGTISVPCPVCGGDGRIESQQGPAGEFGGEKLPGQISVETEPPAVQEQPDYVPSFEPPSIVGQMLAESKRPRRAPGLPDPVLDERLCAAAQDQANYLSQTRTFDHFVNGSPLSRANRRGFRGTVREIIAGPFQTVANAFRGWSQSPGHHSSILADCDRCGFAQAP